MLYISKTDKSGENFIEISDIGHFCLKDTLECGQLFRFEYIGKRDKYESYIVNMGDMLLRVGQSGDTLAVWGVDEKTLENRVVPYLALDRDYEKIRADIKANSTSEWMHSAAEAGKGISILRQSGWESIFSFIVSQNNNIPRIKKILKAICLEYGENLAIKSSLCRCPLDRGKAPSEEMCGGCGVCYSFPSPSDILSEPEKMLKSKPGFRYKYLYDAADKVESGMVNLEKIREVGRYDFTVEELSKIKGVGNKVASCAALFGFGNLEAFPIDVWMRRAIDTYFDGKLDPSSLGKYAGVAQQYIFHYIRNIENSDI